MRFFTRQSTAAKVPGTCALLDIGDHASAGGHRFAMIHSNATQHVTVVLEAGVRSGERWSALFASDGIDVGNSGDITALTAVAETQPHEPARARWVHADADDELVALRMNLLDPSTVAMSARLAVTFDVVVRRARKDLTEQAVEIGRRLPRLIESLAAAGVAVRPMTSVEVVAVVAAAYREDLTVTDFADAVGGDLRERRDMFTHNGFRTASAVMAPARASSDVLETLCSPSLATPRSRVAVTYRREVPVPGRPVRLARMGVVVTVTEPNPIEPSLETKRTGLPLAGRLALRRGYDAQAALMAASLGIGVLLPEHALVEDVAI